MEYYNMSTTGLGIPWADPTQAAASFTTTPQTSTSNKSSVDAFKDWTNAIFGAATTGATTYNTVTGKTPPTKPIIPGGGSNKTLLIGAAAIVGLGVLFVLLKKKGR